MSIFLYGASLKKRKLFRFWGFGKGGLVFSFRLRMVDGVAEGNAKEGEFPFCPVGGDTSKDMNNTMVPSRGGVCWCCACREGEDVVKFGQIFVRFRGAGG